VRYAPPDDFPAVAELDGASFGFQYSAEDRADALLDVDPSRFLVEEDDGRIVGATADMPFTMTLPGGGIRAAGAVAVGGVRLVTLAGAGQANGAAAVLTRFDRALLADRTPSCGTAF
jgi:GNAT acetyltransferase-like protein